MVERRKYIKVSLVPIFGFYFCLEPKLENNLSVSVLKRMCKIVCGLISLTKEKIKLDWIFTESNHKIKKISPDKRNQWLFNFEVLRCNTYRRDTLKKGNAYSKVRKVICIEFQKLSFSISKSQYHYGVKIYIH